MNQAHSVAGGLLAGLELQGANRDVTVMDIPGNHDLWSRFDNREQRAASGHYGGSYPRRVDVSLRTGRQMSIYGLDSNRSRFLAESLANGHVPKRELAEVCRLLEEGARAGRIQGVVLHHPLAVKPGTEPRLLGWEIQKLDKRDAVGRALREAGAKFVLCGHIHTQQLLRKGGARPLQFTAGSGCQIGGPNQFWVLDVHADGVVPHVYRIAPEGIAYESSALELQPF